MERVKNVSKSMISYLKRARDQKEFLLKETREFEKGKRHLANMMGIEPQAMTQQDIDDAITYLFPSGLFDKKARPMMKHPDILFKSQKEVQFDIEGRPHHYLFYTTKPNYFETLSDLSRLVRELNKYEDEQLAKGILDPPGDEKFQNANREWLSYEEMIDIFIERIAESDYQYLIKSLEQLVSHPYSNRVNSFIKKFSRELPEQSLNLVLPEIMKDEMTGQIYTEVIARRREHRVKVKTILNGTGNIDIEGNDILYFDPIYLRRAIHLPLQLSGMQDKVDIIARVVAQPVVLGPAAVAGCIRFAVSQSIAAYMDKDTRNRLRLAGLLCADTRTKERKKFNQDGARRKYTWKKR